MTTTAGRRSRGVIYYAIGEAFVKEALVSAASLKRHMPDLPTAVVTDREVPPSLFDLRLAVDPEVSIKRQKMRALQRSPFEKTLYLDTDTYVADAIDEVFDLLDHVDLAIALEPFSDVVNRLGRVGGAYNEVHGPAARQGVPLAFPEANSGVIAYRKTGSVDRLLASWDRLYAAWDGKKWDQAPLRAALFESDVRWAPLPPPYNFRIHFPGGINGKIKIFHGRHLYLPELCERINRRSDRRLVCQYEFKKDTLYFTSFDVRPTPFGIALTVLKRYLPRRLRDRARAVVERWLQWPRRSVEALRADASPGR